MLFFIVKRLLSGLFVTLSVVVVISSIIYLAPVDPARLTFGQRSEDRAVEEKRAALGLDKPLYVQMIYYLRDLTPVYLSCSELNNYKPKNVVFRINLSSCSFLIKKPYLRESYQTGRSVSAILGDVIPYTIVLALAALLIASINGIFLGFIAAINKDKFIDSFIVGISTLGYSVPSYVSAIILAIVFGYLWSSWTGLNMQGSLIELDDLGDEKLVLKNLILPAIALGVRPVAVITQLTRSSVLDILSQDYVRTAVSKGLIYRKVLEKHVLKNSMNPIVTAITGWLASLLAGAFFVEYVFSYKGLGFTTVTALLNYDIPVILGCVIFVSLIFVLLNIIVDLIYIWLNPREL
jgi:peptide/nickel transport system permease protein